MTRIGFLTALGLWLAATAPAAELPSTRQRPVVIAHRGDHTAAPENSLLAIEAAIRVGADFVEVDLRRTRDGEFVLLHDATVNRTSDGRGKLADLTWAEVEGLRLKDPRTSQLTAARIPKFTEALAAMRGRIGLYLDFKDADRETTAKLLRAAGMTGHTVVYDDVANITAWRKVAPELPLLVSPRAADLRGPGLARLRELYPVEALDDDYAGYTPEAVKRAHAAGFRVWPDIQDGPEGETFWAGLLPLDFDGLQTDKPGELIAFLKQHGLR